jgi:hypothetical protein
VKIFNIQQFERWAERNSGRKGWTHVFIIPSDRRTTNVANLESPPSLGDIEWLNKKTKPPQTILSLLSIRQSSNSLQSEKKHQTNQKNENDKNGNGSELETCKSIQNKHTTESAIQGKPHSFSSKPHVEEINEEVIFLAITIKR